MSKADMELVRKYMPIPFAIYEPGLIIVLGGINEALIASNLIYWNGKGAKPGWIYKTVRQMKLETGLSDAQQRKAIKKLVAMNMVQVKLMDVPAKRYFRINVVGITNLAARNEDIAELLPINLKITSLINERSITKNKNKELNKEIFKLYKFYLAVNNLTDTDCKLTPKRISLLIDRLQDAGLELCIRAVRNAADNDFLNGNSDGTFKGSFEYVFKDYERIEGLASQNKESY
jgi:hypothetical protein